MPVVYPVALHIASRGQFYTLTPLGRTKVPHGIYIIVIGQNLAHHQALAALAWSACFGFSTQLHRYVLSNRRSQAAQKLADLMDGKVVLTPNVPFLRPMHRRELSRRLAAIISETQKEAFRVGE